MASLARLTQGDITTYESYANCEIDINIQLKVIIQPYHEDSRMFLKHET